MAAESFFGFEGEGSTFSIPIIGVIDQMIAARVIGEVLKFNAEDPQRSIRLYVLSHGGQVDAGFGIIDTCRSVENPIATVALGAVASMGALIFSAAAERGSRFIAPNARLMLHQPLGGAVGSASDVEIAARELVRMRKHINAMLSDVSGLPKDRIRRLTDRDRWFSAGEAVELGFADQILPSVKAVGPEAVVK